jgi:glycosyltransferase involved in cell wall biosynthesis
MKTKLFLAVRDLTIGGAERQFLEIVKKIDKSRFDVTVVTLRPGTLDHEVLSEPSVKLLSLQKGGRWDLAFFRRYALEVSGAAPHVVYSFMFDMNVFSAIALAFTRRRPKLIWGIFGSEPDFSKTARFYRTLLSLQRLLENRADLVTSDSKRGFEFLKRYGFRLKSKRIVHSGTDVERFSRKIGARETFRRDHALEEDDVAVGVSSRWVQMKGYPILADAAKQLLVQFPHVKFFSIGYGDEAIQRDAVERLGRVADRFVWLGRVERPEEILSGWDIYCSPSIFGEGFSNSIIEAMAAELPCVVTDVGDAGIQMGDVGVVVEPGQANALAEALGALIIDSEGRRTMGAGCRRRVVEHFSAERMVEKTEQLIEELVWGARRGQNAAGEPNLMVGTEGSRGYREV